jgi:hypothetical protein
MTLPIPAGIQISLDNQATWHKLSDHNRSPISTSYEIIEQSQRMANGTMRKYVISNKLKVSTDWKDLPSLDSNVVDYTADGLTHGAAWIKALYEGNVFNPIYVKLIFAKEIATLNGLPGTYYDSDSTPGIIFNAFITGFTHDLTKRRVGNSLSQGYDYANIKIDLTEI